MKKGKKRKRLPRALKNVQPKIGTFRLGPTMVDLYGVGADTSGGCYLNPDDKNLPRITIGLAHPTWENTVDLLIHEASEFLLLIHQHRYERCNDWGNDHAGYIFHFTHTEFSDFCAKLAPFLTHAMPALAKVWKKYRTK